MQNKNACFQVLDCIDVTLLGSDETIIDIILGKMLDKIRDCEKQPVREIKTDISTIYESLHRTNVYDDAALAVLTGRSKSWKLREDFHDLFHQFNKFFAGKHDCRSCYTVLMIDDIDMNVEHCYEMLEMIRQYLMLPNVIIMMSINYGQLETVCQNYYFGKLFLGKPGDDQLLQSASRSATEMTRAYLEKILPDGRRLYMPDLYREDGAFEKKVGIISTNSVTGEVHHFDIKQIILFNLHRYVRLPFDGQNGEVHYLQPDTLRQLSDYIMQFNHLMLLGGSAREDIKAYEYNSRWFYDDLVNRYITKQLGRESIKKVKEFLGTNLNDKLQFLYRYLRNKLSVETDRSKEGEIFNPKEIGYGEIIDLIRYIELNDLMDWREIQSMKTMLSLIMTRMVFMINRWREIIHTGGDNEEGMEEEAVKEAAGEKLKEWKQSFEDFTRKNVWSRVIDESELIGDVDFSGFSVAVGREISEKEINVGFEYDWREKAESGNSLRNAILLTELASLFLGSFEIHIIENEKGTEAGNESLENNLPGSISLRDISNYRFGSMLYNIWNYREWLDRLDGIIITQLNNNSKAGTSKSTKEELEGLLILNKEMQAWEEKYRTTAVIPFYSVEVMNRIADQLKQDINKKPGSVFFIEPVKMKDALHSIQAALEEVDSFYEKESELLENSERKELGSKYADIFLNCPAVKYLREIYLDKSIFIQIIENAMVKELVQRGIPNSHDETID